jgi:regulator of protease activity HflC (stomatin/prohibitin superfamily)
MDLPHLNAPSLPSARRWAIPAIVVAILLFLLSGSYFVVPQTDVGFVKRFGKVINAEAGPLQPGLHLKVPFIDDPDLISITTDTFELPEKKAFTRDTQELTLRVGVTYRVPTSAAYHLLYEIGRAGNVDIHNNIILLSNEVVREVLSKHNITEIAGEQREMVVSEIKTRLADVLAGILRIEISSVQINSLDFSPQYKDAINQASLARTKTVAAQQDAERAKVEAQTRVTQARAEADAQAARADGLARAQLTQAEAEANGNLARARADAEGNLAKAKAEAEGIKLRGESEAAASRARIEAAGGMENYVRQLDAQSKLRWKGEVPQFVMGGSASNAPSMPIIVPVTAGQAAAPTK